MPWTIDDVESHIKGLSKSQKRKWVDIANNVLRQCQAKNNGQDCEALAIATANSKLKRKSINEYDRETMIRELVEAKIAEYFGGNQDDDDLAEREWDTAYVDDLPDSAFAIIMPGGTKDDEGKTTPRSLRKLPYKDKDGNIDIPHLRNALARLPQVKGVSKALLDKALATLKAAAKKVLPSYQENSLELQELLEAYAQASLLELDIPLLDLPSEIYRSIQRAEMLPSEVRYGMLVNVFLDHPEYGTSALFLQDNALYMIDFDISGRDITFYPDTIRQVKITYQDAGNETVEPAEVGKRLNKKQLETLRQSLETIKDILAWAEYEDNQDADETEESLTSETENIETGELQESASGHVIQLVEAGKQDGRKTPLYLDVAIIQPGFGNARDNHYYSRELLEKYADAFVGAKMYATDHRQDEKSVGTWVSTIKGIKGYTEAGAPIAEVVIHKDWFADDVLALNEAGLLNKMECSILAIGTAKNGKVDGKPAKIVETIDAVSSVDWVTRAGAGGHAIQLSEAETMTDIEIVEDEAESVIITEDTKQDGEPGTKTEVPEPGLTAEQVAEELTKTNQAGLSAEQVAEALTKTNLPEISRKRLAEKQYQDLTELNKAIANEIAYIKSITGSGMPFSQAQGLQENYQDLPYAERIDRIIKKYL